jgi:aminopeptidase YwaD
VGLIETLGSGIGVRTAGSDAAARAADAVAEAFRELGLEPRFQEFSLLGYDPEEPELEVDGEPWEAGPCMYAHPTDGVVERRIRRIGSRKVGEFAPEAHVFAVEDERAGTELARLYASPFGGAPIPFTSGPRQVVLPPGAFISGPDAERLRVREGARARVRIGGRFVPGRRDRNVVAELPGASEERVVVCAHFDSVWRGPGTIDNATGVEGVRRVAERLLGRQLERTVVLCAFAAEEIGLLGARHYVSEAELSGELERTRGVVNLDCIAHGERLELLASPDELRGRALGLADALGLTARYNTHAGVTAAGVDSVPFAEAGVPAASILYFPYPEYHLPSERRELVDERRLADAVDLAVALVESQLERPVERPR